MGDLRFYIDRLRSEECDCGRDKKRGQAFCPGCYFKLPHDMRSALYLPLCGGFEEAFERAVEYLND